MAEAAAALGVAAAAVQFFECGLKILNLCKQIRDSEQGATEANQELELSMGVLKEIYAELRQDVKFRPADRQVARTRQDCVAVIDELQKLLNNVKGKSRSGNVAAAKAAFRVMRGKREIEKLHNRLIECQKRFDGAVSVETRNGVARLLEEQSKSSETLLVLAKGVARLEAGADKRLIDVRQIAHRDELLASLHYPEIFDRQQTIKPPAFETFEWIFDDNPVANYTDLDAFTEEASKRREMRGKFARWLREDGALFWISGKAGSGKSSLMSLIQDDDRTHEALSTWAHGRKLYTFSFYFWRAGTSLQKSIRGLLRSLLYQLIKAKPAVLDLVFSVKSAHYNDWTTKSLLAALHNSLGAFSDQRIFLMVDGLDEYEDQYTELLGLLLTCQQRPYMKICLASRPENVISARLKLFPSLRLQDLNAEDINQFIRGKLSSSEASLRGDLVDELIDRAEGVFLWAALVVKSMISGALAGDSAETLKLRLDTTPKELNDLFEQLLLNVDKFHQQSLSTALYHLGMNRSSIINTSIGLITASSPGFNASMSIQDFFQELPKTADRLVAQCQGLVEVYADGKPFCDKPAWIFDFELEKPTEIDRQQWKSCYSYRIQLVHRSAHDFLFDYSNFGEDHDLEKQVDSTLDGLAWLMQHGPTTSSAIPWIREAGQIVRSSFDAADRLGPAYKPKHYSWLDKLHANLSLWFPPERMEVPDSMNDNAKICRPLAPWYVIAQVWGTIIERSHEYAESRWNLLIQHPKASAICSDIFAVTCEYDWDVRGRKIPDLLLHQVTDVLRETRGRTAAEWVAHTREREFKFGPFIMSWAAQGNADESEIINNLSYGVRFTPSGKRFSIFWEILREFELFVGTQSFFPESVPESLAFAQFPSSAICIPLQIQISVYSAQQRMATHAQIVCPPYYRIVCLMKKTSRVGQISPTSMFEHCDGSVVGIFEPCLETIGRLLGQDTLGKKNESFGDEGFCLGDEGFCFGDEGFPRFAGSQAAFLTCLGQILEDIWANKDGKLGAWQQLYMLSCVKKWFKNFWTIVDPDTDG